MIFEKEKKLLDDSESDSDDDGDNEADKTLSSATHSEEE